MLVLLIPSANSAGADLRIMKLSPLRSICNWIFSFLTETQVPKNSLPGCEPHADSKPKVSATAQNNRFIVSPS
jgi:hypothetical protein